MLQLQNGSLECLILNTIIAPCKINVSLWGKLTQMKPCFLSLVVKFLHKHFVIYEMTAILPHPLQSYIIFTKGLTIFQFFSGSHACKF